MRTLYNNTWCGGVYAHKKVPQFMWRSFAI